MSFSWSITESLLTASWMHGPYILLLAGSRMIGILVSRFLLDLQSANREPEALDPGLDFGGAPDGDDRLQSRGIHSGNFEDPVLAQGLQR